MTQLSNTSLEYYSKNALSFANSTNHVNMSDLYEPFVKELADANGRILDLGCGSGRDAKHFADLGYQVTAIDGSPALIDWARYHQHTVSQYKIDWQCLPFNAMPIHQWYEEFKGIWACASLLHVDYNLLPDMFNDLFHCLQPNGVLYASFKYGETERQEGERFFCDLNEDRLNRALNLLSSPFNMKTWKTIDKRTNHATVWLNVLIKKQ